MGRIIVGDGAQLHYKDWGKGAPIVFSHAWPLTSDAWEDQMVFLGEHGYRCIAHDRRGHGRSSQPYDGNDMDTYADDLKELLEMLDLRSVTLVGHGAGSGEVARYIGRHGNARIARIVMVSSIAPLMVRNAQNPLGTPRETFDRMRAALLADRSQFLHDFSAPFYGANREGANVTEGIRDHFWLQGMAAGLKNAVDCIKAFSETDFTEDLKRIEVPTLIIHGDDDQIVPIGPSAIAAAKLVRRVHLEVYRGGPHGIPTMMKDRLDNDLLAFVEGRSSERAAQ